MVVNKVNLSSYALGINKANNLKFSQQIHFCAGSEDKKPEKKRSLTAKKWGAGLAGPFLGNLVNGKPGRAFAYLGIMAGLGVASGLSIATRNAGARAIAGIAGLAGLATYIYGIVDVVQHVKPDKE